MMLGSLSKSSPSPTCLRRVLIFANEKTQLEFVCQSLGMEALITTKYHAEYAGEGIEYSWGAAKAVYQRYPLASKKGKEKFVTLVSKCTSRESLTTDLIRKFSR
jgi:hypothetical protein